MITVKVTFKNGDYLITRINTNLIGAKKYYLGNLFNIASYKSIITDNMQEAINVEEIITTSVIKK